MNNGICWYCYWGWAEQVRTIFDKFVNELGIHEMEYSHAHIVWCDENFEDHNIQSCLNACKDAGEENGRLADSLRELLNVPESIRCCEPKDYDGIHPENYPPPTSIQMKKENV